MPVQSYSYGATSTQTILSNTTGVYSNTFTSRTARYRHFQKPDNNVHNPQDATGWRAPSGWSMDFRDGMQYCQGSHNYGFMSGSPYKARVVGALSAFSCPIAPLRSPTPAQIAQVEIGCLLKVKDAKVNLGVSFGERLEVANMFEQNARALGKAARAFRKGKLKAAAKALGLTWKDVPSKWLEFQYGWKPLVSEIYSGCEAILEADRKDQKRTWYTVKDGSSVKINDRYNAGDNGSGITWSHNGGHSDVKCRFDFGPPVTQRDKLLQDLDQWGILNPAEIAWELLPFSFIVDWAVPVGDFLSALTAGVPYSFKGGTRTDFTEVNTTNTVSFHAPAAGRINNGSGYALSTSRRFRRHVYVNFPSPSISALQPHAASAAAQSIATRCANALSILATNFR